MEVPALRTDRRVSRQASVFSSFNLHLPCADMCEVDMEAVSVWKSTIKQLYEYVLTDWSDMFTL